MKVKDWDMRDEEEARSRKMINSKKVRKMMKSFLEGGKYYKTVYFLK